MQQHYLSRIFNFFTLACASVLLAYSAHQLFRPATSGLASPMPLIGQVESSQNTVKLKKAHLFSWNDVDPSSQVNAEDMIFTYKDSTSTIQLGDSKSIIVMPETMLRLQAPDQLELQQGVAQFQFKQKNSTLTISLGGRTVTLSSGDAQVTIRKGKGQDSIQVQSGSVQVQSQTEQIQLQQGQQLTLLPDENQISQLDFELLTPTEDVIVSDRPQTEVKFTFNSSSDQLELLIDQQADFTPPYLHKVSSVTSGHRINMNPGKYFWKIQSEQGQSKTQSFEVHFQAPAPIHLSPQEGSHLTNYDQSPLEFHWTGQAQAQFYHIEILQSDGRVQVSEVVTEPKWQWSTPTDGEYSWRVRSFDQFIQGYWSELQNIQIEKRKFIAEDPMVIELKRPDQKVTFEWQTSSSEDESLFTVSMDQDFTSIFHQSKIKGNSTNLVFPTVGTYYWKISGQAQPKKVIIRPTPPPAKPKELPSLKLKLQTQLQKSSFWNWLIPTAHAMSGYVDLKWPQVEEAKSYHIEIYTDADLQKQVTSFTSTKNQKRWHVPRAGKYYWRMSYQDHWGRNSPYSDPSELDIAPAEITANKNKPATVPTKKQELTYHPTPKYFQYQLGMQLTPSLVDYQHSTGHQYRIKGTAVSGTQLNFQTRFVGNKNYGIKYHAISGKVFDDQDFIQRQISAHYLHNWKALTFNLGLISHQVSSYQTQNDKPQFDTVSNAMAAQLGLIYPIPGTSLELQGHASAGTFTQQNLSVVYKFQFSNQIQGTTEAGYTRWELPQQDDQIRSSNTHLSLGANYLF